MSDRDLVRLYWPFELRPAFDALFAIDDALAAIVASSTQPALGAVRLAWWREALERLDRADPPAEPRLRAAATELLPRGVSGDALAGLEDGWAALLDEHPDFTRIARRGQRLFVIGARLLGSDADVAAPGRLFAAVQAARLGQVALRQATLPSAPPAPKRARPLTALAALAARDIRRGGPPYEPEATPGRAWTLLRHRWTGRL
ncbi:hypothetical protein ABDK56_01980 [Sphingomonas sp. ASV193]|uniref:hypothetical protein n=1 Tax=Sphingomonas sp. ASV193 TaxID=3144405 RepID=UPI0032E8AF42